ncbi:hypothetical protein ScPMuIL_005511 [Solemya velum]
MADCTTCSGGVDLGFVETVEGKLLKSHYFPSKVGGKPAWLSQSTFPGPVICPLCQKPMIFLLQVYSPVETKDEAFHRTLFVFLCRDVLCCKKNNSDNFLVLRSQLPRDNDFYSFEPPDDESADEPVPASWSRDVCVVCGAHAPKKCGKCHVMSYCSKQHQICDWKQGHKSQCSGDVNKVIEPLKDHHVLFPEFELVIEPENSSEESEKGEKEKMNDYRNFLKSKAANNMVGSSDMDDLDKMAASSADGDKLFMKFREKISEEPEQVLRYDKGQEPIWVSSENIPTETDVPPCVCGAPRQFEFQVLPQLLNHLDLDSLGPVLTGECFVSTPVLKVVVLETNTEKSLYGNRTFQVQI